ncbi:desmoglein-2.1-like isoform X3 [Neoarius graeffei]|uniref:desmoglein-2.1-like isoform X3 n=1 Tax=Neoarius graeffei TaxID=443677 RepID=UPI00298BF8BE|nr:desmoglein-2.1-like isoform X3 [Neoarius graeffei]
MAFLKLGRLSLLLLMFMTVATQTVIGFMRKKREWLLPPTKLQENVDYTKQEFILKIRSDKDTGSKPFEYSLRGPGADKEPFNLFIVNPQNGFVRITGILDREKVSKYNLTGIAKYKGGSLAEEGVELKIEVEDENDSTPVFKLFTGTVRECSPIGTPVMQVTAEDADQQGTPNSKIAYSILKQIPEQSGNMFTIDRETGKISVKEHTLDREVCDSYTLIVQGVDMDGAPSGNTGTGTVKIKVLDINDNAPTIEKDEYTGTIDEGAVDVVVMRIKALDKDLENTDNWRAVFDIVKGNEDELFTIETDPKTNEGILKLVKPVDYEKVKMVDLNLAVSNEAAFINGTAQSLGLNLDRPEAPGITTGAGVGVDAGAGVGVKPGVKPDGKPSSKPGIKSGSKPDKKPQAGGKKYPIKISVNNLPEGPRFSPSVKELPVSEDLEGIHVPVVIGSFPALDLDTGEIAEHVRYAKGYDPDNWLSIDEKTSEIKLTKIPDRESKSLVNGSYIAKILCMTKETTVSFLSKEHLWIGFYELSLEIFDRQDKGCKDKQKLQLEVCICEKGGTCGPKLVRQRGLSVKVGFPAIGVLIGALILLMLIPLLLLLFCQCGTFREFSELPFDTKEYLMAYHTEGNGEDQLLDLLSAYFVADQQTVAAFGSSFNQASMVQSAQCLDASMLNKEPNGDVMEDDDISGYQLNTIQAQQFIVSPQRNTPHSASFRHKVHNTYAEMAPLDGYLHGYFSQKTGFLADNPVLNDSPLMYNDEGQNSPVGSIGCCSILQDENGLGFLDDLDPKFVNLATICSPPPPKLENVEQILKSVDTSLKSESSVATSAVQVVQSDQPPPQQSTITNVIETINKSDSINSNLTLLIQQQPLYYLVKHQAPSAIIFAEEPIQEMYLINGPARTQGLVLQGGNILQNAVEQQEMYLIDGMPMLQGNIMLGNCLNLASAGSLALSTVLVQGQEGRKQLQVSLPQDTQPGNSEDENRV